MPTILIVEDDKTIASFVSMILMSHGYLSVEAADVPRARDALKSGQKIDLVVLDQNLGDPSETGLTLLMEMRQSPRLRSVPVVVCTGDARPQVIATFARYGISGFLKKPFRAERLLAEISSAIVPSDSEPMDPTPAPPRAKAVS